MKKKVLAVLMLTLMVFSIVPYGVLAEASTGGKSLRFVVDTSSGMLKKSTSKAKNNIVISGLEFSV